jgi:adenylate cyclase
VSDSWVRTLARARVEAEAALAIEPSLTAGHYALAKYHFYMGAREAFVAEAEEALRLGPGFAVMLADLGRLYAKGLARFEDGAAMARRAIALNPHYPSWYRWPIFDELMFTERFGEALEEMQRIEEPEIWRLVFLCILHTKLGDGERAKNNRERLLRDHPDYDSGWARDILCLHPSVHDMMRAWHIDAGLPLAEDTAPTS